MTVRTRFAVSPTGYMHVGGARNALFDWLYARQHGGQLILRIEDTDQAREAEGAVAHIIESLKWLGIEWDEGPDIGGEGAPYTQSERLEIYKDWAQKLVDSGRAYADPYSSEELQGLREQAQAEKRAFLYRDHRPENPPVWNGTQPLRFKSDPKAYTWNDTVMGELHAGAEAVDDFILIKGDGFPTYNFCHIIDDHLMGVSDVIRSQEFLASVPKYLNLYDALGIEWPTFTTLPWIMGPDGKKKLSKRDGAKDVLDYARDGYLPETMLNFLATLGWNDGTEQEIYTRDELLEKFSLNRIQKSGARFDEQRLTWMNGQHIRLLELDDLYERVTDFWSASADAAQEDHKRQVLALVQDRLKTLKDLPTATDYFFTDPTANWQMVDDNKQLKKLSREEHVALLKEAKVAIGTSQFDTESLQITLNELLEQTGQKPGTLFSLIRFAITWAPFSPGLPETMAILGKEVVLQRIEQSITQA